MIENRLGITIFKFSCLLLFCFSLRAESIEQEPILIPANSAAGFEYPYYLLLPESLSSLEKLYLIVETNNSGVQSDFSAHIEITRNEILGNGPGPMVADDLDMPLLLPVFPRSSDTVLV